ncbi:MAG: hypothetical protein AAGB04_00025 [Pseudomonadota bacterium]
MQVADLQVLVEGVSVGILLLRSDVETSGKNALFYDGEKLRVAENVELRLNDFFEFKRSQA